MKERVVQMVASKRSEEELVTAFLQAPGHPLYEAMVELIDESYLAAANAARDPGLTPKETDHVLGEMDALAKLRENMEAQIREGRELEKERERGAKV